MAARVYIWTVVELESSVYERTFYLRLHPLRDDVSSPATMKNRLRDARALHYGEYATDDEYNETDVLSPLGSGVPDEWTQIDQLHSAIIQTRKRRAGRRLLIWLLIAVAIVITLVLTGTP